MGIFNKNKKNTSEFNQEQYMNNGNLYDVYQKLKAQQNIDLSTIPNFHNVVDKIQDKLSQLNSKFVEDKTIQDYWLLQLHANYFTNTIVYKCNNPTFYGLIQDVIRAAWINGKAGIFFNKTLNKYYGIVITRITKNTYGEIETIEYYPLSLLDSIEDYENLSNKKVLYTIKGEDCKNCAIFKWGTAAIGCWLIYWPFVRFQNMLLKMITVQSLSFNKKNIYKAINPKADLKEMELWYDPLNVFIVNTMGDELGNKFSTNEIMTDDAVNFIEYYKQAIGCYYSVFGRRTNLDFKRERNTVEEVSMTSGSIENIERDWFTQFIIFVEHIKEINEELKMIENLEIDEIRLNNWIREERLQGQLSEKDNEMDYINKGKIK